MSSQVTPESGQDSYLDTSRLARPELIGIGSALVLLISLWLPWFTTSSNPNSKITSAGIGPDDHANAWQTFSTLQWLLVLISVAPIVLAWIVARRHSLGWRTGEVTMVAGVTGVVLVLCNGIVLGRPDPGIEVGLSIGYLVALLACCGILASGFMRQNVGPGGPRKPPGSL